MVKYRGDVYIDQLGKFEFDLQRLGNQYLVKTIEGTSDVMLIKEIHTSLNSLIYKDPFEYKNNHDFVGILNFNSQGHSHEVQIRTVQFGPILHHGLVYKGPVLFLKESRSKKLDYLNLSNGCSFYSETDAIGVKNKAVLVGTGECTLAQQALYAQSSGAALILVVDRGATSTMEFTDVVALTEDHDGIDQIEIPMFVVSNDYLPLLADTDITQLKISAIFRHLLDNTLIFDEKLQFGNIDIPNIILHGGKVKDKPMDSLFRNSINTAFIFKTKSQCFPNLCKI